MSSMTVNTSKELKQAIEMKADKIIVTGAVANKIKKAENMKKFSPAILTMIGALVAVGTAGIVAGPPTGGLSYLFVAPTYTTVSVATGLSIPVLIFIAAVGVTVLSTLFDEYTRVEIGDGKIVYERKKKIS